MVEGICADCDLDYELQLLLFGLVQNCHLQLYMGKENIMWGSSIKPGQHEKGMSSKDSNW
ncbi:hypothetical protein BLOT_005648 [Blomia tropicalis]|nr:hypothetical protein BLOT_005648 [Blomia tropicalis]